MSDSLVTVICSSYNRPKLIRDALDSILEQAWPHVQCIVADDWSNDETLNVIENYSDRFFARWGIALRIEQPEDEPGPHERQWGFRCAHAINAALPHVRGDYLAFLPDDDFLAGNDSLGVRARFLDEHPEVNAVYGHLQSCVSLTGEPGIGRHTASRERLCRHDGNSWWQAEPVARIANHADHGMPMVRVRNPLPAWPEMEMEHHNEAFRCPDAAWFYVLEARGFGPFHSVKETVVVKRYGHRYGHRSDPTRRE